MTYPFASLPMFGFNIIMADPPWNFDNYSKKGEGRNPNRHYETMAWWEIAALPVGDLAARDCACFLWCVDPLLDKGFDVLRAWGFRFVTVAFTWAKRSSTGAAFMRYGNRKRPQTGAHTAKGSCTMPPYNSSN